MSSAIFSCSSAGKDFLGPPNVDVVIEIPRGSFLIRGLTGREVLVSPLACPLKYGSKPHLVGLYGDLLDVAVLGAPAARRAVRGD